MSDRGSCAPHPRTLHPFSTSPNVRQSELYVRASQSLSGPQVHAVYLDPSPMQVNPTSHPKNEEPCPLQRGAHPIPQLLVWKRACGCFSSPQGLLGPVKFSKIRGRSTQSSPKGMGNAWTPPPPPPDLPLFECTPYE